MHRSGEMPSASGPEPLIGPCGPVRRRRGARDTRESFRITTGRVDGRPKESGRGGIHSRKLYTVSAKKMVAERRTLHSTPEIGPRRGERQENRRHLDWFAESVGCMDAERNALAPPTKPCPAREYVPLPES